MSSFRGSPIYSVTQARARSAPRAVVLGLVVSISLISACEQSPEKVATDSLLTRDLTLATTSTGPAYTPGLSDTAVSDASVVPARREVAKAGAPTATPTQTAPRPAPQKVVRKAPAPIRAPVPVSASVPEAKTTSSTPPVMPPLTAPAAPVSAAAAGTSKATSRGDGSGDAARAGSGRHVFGSGTTLIGRTNAEICSLANRPGDRLVATLTSDVVSPDGTKLTAGTPVLVEMSAPATNGDFVFRVKAVQVAGQLVPIEGTVSVAGETSAHEVSKGGDKGKVISGAIAGAIIGRVLGGGVKGTIIGAAGGAAAGSAAASRNTVTEKCLPSGATLTVTLTAPLVLAEGVP